MEAIFIQTESGIVGYVLQNKDLFAVIFGLAALAVSGITLMQKVTEVRRSLRSQTTDVLSKLSTASIDLEKVRGEYERSSGDYRIGAELDKVKKAVHALAHQAHQLILQIPYLTNEVEYANLASAFETVGDDLMADLYWDLAVEARPVKVPWYRRSTQRRKRPEETDLYAKITKARHLRGYGAFLHSQGKEKEGDEKFNQVLELLKSTADDQALFELGFTYRKFAKSKVKNRRKGLPDDALRELFSDYMKKAAETYKKLNNEDRIDRMKTELIDDIQGAPKNIKIDSEALKQEVEAILKTKA